MILSKFVESISIVGRKVHVVSCGNVDPAMVWPLSRLGALRGQFPILLCSAWFSVDLDTTQWQVERYDATSVSGALNVWRPGHCLWCRCKGCWDQVNGSVWTKSCKFRGLHLRSTSQLHHRPRWKTVWRPSLLPVLAAPAVWSLSIQEGLDAKWAAGCRVRLKISYYHLPLERIFGDKIHQISFNADRSGMDALLE